MHTFSNLFVLNMECWVTGCILNYRFKGKEVEHPLFVLKLFCCNKIRNGCSVTVTNFWFSVCPPDFMSREQCFLYKKVCLGNITNILCIFYTTSLMMTYMWAKTYGYDVNQNNFVMCSINEDADWFAIVFDPFIVNTTGYLISRYSLT
jgi:hypothetical protein